MAYNYNFPVGYQGYYPQYQSPNTQQNNTSLIWVQGETGAKSYMVAPNNTIALWDSESQTVYLKSADASGMPSMRILDYTIREDASKTPLNANKNDFVTKDEIVILQNQINEIKANLRARKDGSDESTIPAT
jgi:hypothetical protein